MENLIHPKAVDLQILTALSTDARASAAEIGKKVNLSATATKYRVHKIEEKYGIKYTIQIAQRPFGLFRYAIFVKFINKKPDSAEIKSALGNIPWIQLVAVTSGEYDLFIYLFAENTHNLEEMVYSIRSDTRLSRYKSYWYVNYITDAYGYVPLRDKFFEALKERVWHKTERSQRRPHGSLLEREFLILKALNRDGNANFSELDKTYGFSEGSSAYTYYKLLESKIIRRATITMTKPPIKYNLIVYGVQTDVFRFNLKRKYYLLDVIKETKTPTNRYILTGDVGSPYGIIRVFPVYDEEELIDLENFLKHVKGAIDIQYMQVKQTIIGEWGYRRIDNTTAVQHQILQNLP